MRPRWAPVLFAAGATAAYYGGGGPYAYYGGDGGGGPYGYYSGPGAWSQDYAARNGIICQPGTLVRLGRRPDAQVPVRKE